jgi:hypothetical protein
MPFDPSKVSVPILNTIKTMLEEAGMTDVAHIVVAYDGAEVAEGKPPSYMIGSHFYPATEEHRQCHTFVVQAALRVVGPDLDDDATGYITQYLPDGSILVLPASLAALQSPSDDEDGGE